MRCACFMPKGHEPLHKVTIIPARARAPEASRCLLPERDKWPISRSSRSKRMLAASSAATESGTEEEPFGPGACHHRRHRTSAATTTAAAWSPIRLISEKLGPLRYSEQTEEVFLGRSVTQRKRVKDATAKVIDDEDAAASSRKASTARAILDLASFDELRRWRVGCSNMRRCPSDEIRRLIKGERIVAATPRRPAL